MSLVHIIRITAWGDLRGRKKTKTAPDVTHLPSYMKGKAGAGISQLKQKEINA